MLLILILLLLFGGGGGYYADGPAGGIGIAASILIILIVMLSADDEYDVDLSVENGLAEIVLNRPDKLNALNDAMVAELNGCLERAASGARGR